MPEPNSVQQLVLLPSGARNILVAILLTVSGAYAGYNSIKQQQAANSQAIQEIAKRAEANALAIERLTVLAENSRREADRLRDTVQELLANGL